MEVMSILLGLASSSFTSIEYWEKKTFTTLTKWGVALNNKGADNSG